MPKESFSYLLRQYRLAVPGLSQNRLARRAGLDPAYVHRMESGGAPIPVIPRRPVVDVLAEQLGLTGDERDRFVAAAGYCPPSLQALEKWEPCIGQVARVLSDPRLGTEDRDEFRTVISAIARRWTL